MHSTAYHPLIHVVLLTQFGHRILRNFLVSTGLDAKPEPVFHKAAAE